jgi:hypothetical protein
LLPNVLPASRTKKTCSVIGTGDKGTGTIIYALVAVRAAKSDAKTIILSLLVFTE